MPGASSLRGPTPTLLTDLYQLTMAYGYWKSGVAETRAAFHLFFRKNPFGGGYTVTSGLRSAFDMLASLRFDAGDLEYLASLRGSDDRPLFEAGFIEYLGGLRFTCDVDAMAEGTVAFPHEPLVRVTGPVLQCQIIETPLLNLINFETLIATKAARICGAAEGQPVLEFGLRRAQGADGALAASRAAYVGGCAATSNLLAGKLYGIPVKGTHAHSWVMFFADEQTSFDAYAAAMPANCVFLVDTYDTVEGVKRAIEIGHRLRERGHNLLGVRLDSGDLAHLSLEARRLLDEAGFPEAAIVASNDLDEHIITSLRQQGAAIGMWGVGTKMVTAFDQPALGGVYKLSAVQQNGAWQHRIKLSEQPIKISNPGLQQVRRFVDQEGMFVADMIYDQDLGAGPGDHLVDLQNTSWRDRVPDHAGHVDLLEPLFRAGAPVGPAPELEGARARAADQLAHLDGRVRRLVNPQLYAVGLEPRLAARKQELVDRARGLAKEPS